MQQLSTALPQLVYGTAWKEYETERLTLLALEAGFRGIDTANQRKHYHEAQVGSAIAKAIARGLVDRDALFVQTKFTSVDGQDHRLPYDGKADPRAQVEQSFASSLEHLQIESLDSYVLHGPTTHTGIAPYDLEVWRAMEALQNRGATRLIGVSNIALDQLEELCERAYVAPAFVQNRCYARTGWDRDVRSFCTKRGIVYQGFSLLTANRTELSGARFSSLCSRLGKTAAQIVFRFAVQLGMQPLTGTSDAMHMREDLAIDDFTLTADELHLVEYLA